MKDKWTDLAAGRLGPAAAQEPAPDDSPDGRRPGRAPAVGNYGIGRLGIVPAGAGPAAPAKQQASSEAQSGSEGESAESAPFPREAPPRRTRLLESVASAFDPPRTGCAAPPAEPESGPASLPQRVWRAVASRPVWAACACGAAILCGVLGFVLLKSGTEAAPQVASAQPAQAFSAGSGQVPTGKPGQTAAPQPADRDRKSVV